MRIGILHPSYEDSTAPFKDLDPPCVPDRYLSGHEYTSFQIRKTTAGRQVVDIARMRFDVVINLCDGAWDEDRAGIEVVQALEDGDCFGERALLEAAPEHEGARTLSPCVFLTLSRAAYLHMTERCPDTESGA